jgi:O-methyltransferase
VIRKMTKKFRYSAGFRKVHDLLSLKAEERMLDMAFAFVRWGRLTGDYLEFGVYDGWSMTAAYHLAEKHGLSHMRFLGFDSFEGLPAMIDIDKFPFQQFDRGELRCDQATVERNLRRNGVDMSRVSLTKGWYSDTLNAPTRERLALTQAAVVWIDCDLYSSTVQVLNFVAPVLQEGTVLVMDDWFLFRAHPERGERRAFTEWLERHSDLQVTPFVKPGWHEASFIAHPAADRAAVDALLDSAATARQPAAES